MTHSRTLAVTTLAATFALATPAFAAERFAEPDGDGPNTCLQANPCTIETAVTFAQPGDRVKLVDGTHVVNADIDVLKGGITIEPATPGTRPVVASTSNSEPVFSVQANTLVPTVIRGLEIMSQSIQTVDTHPAISSSTPMLLSDTRLRSRGRVLRTFNPQQTTIEDVTVTQVAALIEPAAQLEGAGTTVRRVSVVAATDGVAMSVGGEGTQLTDSTVGGGATGLVVLNSAGARRVTASGVSTGIRAGANTLVTDSVASVSGGGTAVKTEGGAPVRLRNVTAFGNTGVGMSVTGAGTVTDARNVVAQGALTDVQAALDGKILMQNSNFDTKQGNGVGDAGGNQAGDPEFVDAAGGDLHLKPGSPAIDAGATDDLIGSTDRDGFSRFQGAAPDLGAYETAPQGVAPGPPAPGTPAPGTPGTSVDTTAPVVSKFKASGVRTKSAALSFTLSEGATGQVVLQKGTSGKRQGGKCVKPTARNRRAKTCPRSVTLVTTRKTLAKGAVAVKVGSRLTAGRYTVRVTAKDAAGNRSRTATATFTIKAPTKKKG